MSCNRYRGHRIVCNSARVCLIVELGPLIRSLSVNSILAVAIIVLGTASVPKFYVIEAVRIGKRPRLTSKGSCRTRLT